MEAEALQHTLLPDLKLLSVEYSLNDLLNFNDSIDDNDLPNEMTLRLDELDMKINRKRKEFRVLKINHKYCNRFDYVNIAKAIKIARRSGYDIFYEPKFMN